jgi:hypothetical protein
MTRLTVLAAVFAALLAGCDPIERLQNDKLLAAVLVESPAVAQQGVNVPGTTLATVFFGTVNRGAAPGDPGGWQATGISGANVRITWAGGSVSLAPVPGAAGQYALAGGLAYSPGTAYTFRVESEGDVYSGTVSAPDRPAPQDAGGATLQVVQPAVLHANIPDPYVLRRAGTNPAFYTVTSLSSQTGSLDVSAPTCTNAPDLTDPLDVLRLLFDDAPWRAPSFSLSRAECFPTPAPFAYGILLTAVNKVGGTNLSSNLFLGSGVVVGSTAASVLPLQR